MDREAEGEGHLKTEAKTGVVPLQTKAGHGLLATTRSYNRGLEPILPAHTLILDPRPPGCERVRLCVLSRPVTVLRNAAPGKCTHRGQSRELRRESSSSVGCSLCHPFYCPILVPNPMSSASLDFLALFPRAVCASSHSQSWTLSVGSSPFNTLNTAGPGERLVWSATLPAGI